MLFAQDRAGTADFRALLGEVRMVRRTPCHEIRMHDAYLRAIQQGDQMRGFAMHMPAMQHVCCGFGAYPMTLEAIGEAFVHSIVHC